MRSSFQFSERQVLQYAVERSGFEFSERQVLQDAVERSSFEFYERQVLQGAAREHVHIMRVITNRKHVYLQS